jgi:H+/Cl- antiporter ClcA
MISKRFVMLGATVGTLVGGWVPTLFGADPFEGWSILGGMIGGFAGIWMAVWLSKRYS